MLDGLSLTAVLLRARVRRARLTRVRAGSVELEDAGVDLGHRRDVRVELDRVLVRRRG